MNLPKSRKHSPSRSGQAILFLVLTIVVLVFAALWSADIHRILFVKSRSQNAGDAAALAAARWQASTLNLIGELNLLHALALAMGDSDAVDLITNTQSRLCFTGPMAGMAAAQQAAKLNRIYVNPDFTDLVRDHADVVRQSYSQTVGDSMMFPEPYPGAWDEYATMLETLAADGIAAGADNAIFYTDQMGGHVLLDRGFYDAIAGKNWCWFFLNTPGLLDDYSGYTWWPGLPPADPVQYRNAEFFGLGVLPVSRPLARLLPRATLESALAEAGRTDPLPQEPSGEWVSQPSTWFVYDPRLWGRWEAMTPPFPVTGPVRPEFDYLGADALTRVEAGMDRFTPGTQGDGVRRDSIVWTAAAKPFGYLDLEGGRTVPTLFGLVLPAYRQVRLIPIDAASLPGGGSFDLNWRRHVVEHLPPYLERGIPALQASCWYCARLVTWEDAGFRREGVEWLRLYSDRCLVSPSGGGGGRGGGTRRAH